MQKILVTGGSGFIGSNFIKYWLKNHPTDIIINYDSQTYAARPKLVDDDNVVHIKGCVTDLKLLSHVLGEYKPDVLVHMAAESHVCRSIDGPLEFFKSNATGTYMVLEAWRKYDRSKRIVYVSTDEVFGELGYEESPWNEWAKLDPRSPYAASKAAGDMMAMAYFHTYGMNICITNCSNNFGPNQHHEKLVPRTIQLLLNNKSPTVYGNGKQIRDWIFVEDHCSGIETVIAKGEIGQRYNLGGELEMQNVEMINEVYQATKELLPGQVSSPLSLTYTDDRPTDDKRYGMDTVRMRKLGWKPRPHRFRNHLLATCEWYIMNGFK